jgi:transcriptional regulator with XRE-family HTH domain
VNRLEEVRRARQWTKAELARRAGLHASTVGAIESGRLRPYPGQLQKLCRALRISVADASHLLDEVVNGDEQR